MYARMTTFQTKPDIKDEGIAIYRDSVVPAAKEQRGFKGALFLVDEEQNRAVSITFWDTKEDMLAGAQSGYYQAQVAKAAPFITAPPVQEDFEVTVEAT